MRPGSGRRTSHRFSRTPGYRVPRARAGASRCWPWHSPPPAARRPLPDAVPGLDAAPGPGPGPAPGPGPGLGRNSASRGESSREGVTPSGRGAPAERGRWGSGGEWRSALRGRFGWEGEQGRGGFGRGRGNRAGALRRVVEETAGVGEQGKQGEVAVVVGAPAHVPGRTPGAAWGMPVHGAPRPDAARDRQRRYYGGHERLGDAARTEAVVAATSRAASIGTAASPSFAFLRSQLGGGRTRDHHRSWREGQWGLCQGGLRASCGRRVRQRLRRGRGPGRTDRSER